MVGMTRARLALYFIIGWLIHAVAVFGFAVLSSVNIKYSLEQQLEDNLMYAAETAYSITFTGMFTSLISSLVVFVVLWFLISKRLK